ncbi:uveal autoantigen with coiled-coil domains and ankyrin repeats protein-like isoform X2 [Mizuhopecten yessoensis]|uniref:uveal autoantigen with coiled-coil domains and ankyrin repeats protein-like isoform X2 n=1 Tax=Mizuhopecten yessoensis TaxID=6573 RepID=UPI000B45EB57|nr:uveal autoantigen with coiled-coil domains and ankyrin repeats protein-like isoform X2 [Mizuhopecten yessoensis]
MAQSDELEIIEGWYGPYPDEMLEEIKQKAKKDIGEMDKTINRLDQVVRVCQDFQRKNISLCPKCRARCSNKNNVSAKTERPQNTDKEHSEKQNKKTLVSRVSHLPVISKTHEDKMKDKDFSTVFKSKKPSRKGAQSSSTEMTIASEDFQLVLEAKNSAFENLHKKTASEYENLEMFNAKLKEENEHLQSKLSSTMLENENLKIENGKLKEENEQLESTVSSNQKGLKEQITGFTNQITEQKKQIGELENDLDKKDDELRMVKKELAEAKRPRVKDIVLGIRSERSGMGKTMIEMVNRELSGQLQNILEKENVRLTVKQCAAATDVPKGLMAVLCLDMSRVGTNIKDALAGIKVNRDVFVIVFHHTSKENLSSLTPTSLRITGSEQRQLGAIIDMVFSSDSD